MEPPPRQHETHLVTSADSPELSLLRWALRRSPLVGLDAEWKPSHLTSGPSRAPSSFPSVTLLQIACRVHRRPSDPPAAGDSLVFLVDLLSVPILAIYEDLRDLFVNPNVLKLGFRFKQDLKYLSATFCSHECEPGFDQMEPYLDITSVYYLLKNQNVSRRFPKETKSLATICEEILGVSLSKELQVSDWSFRPLSEDQMSYAAADAYYLLEIFSVFQSRFQTKDCDVVPLDEHVLTIIKRYSEKIVLTELDKKPRSSRQKGKQSSSLSAKSKEQVEYNVDWQGLPPWDPSFGGDGSPKFLCDVMVEGLAKHLRCVGIDAAIPSLRKPDPRQLLDQAYKEKRVLITRDVKLLKYQYLVRNQVYLVKGLLKNEQLLEVIQTFQLKITEDQLMSRCTKCNGRFIQKPLTTEEAIEASKGFQVIPNCLFNRDIEFWQCTDCKQLYWEGTQYHNAIQKFVAVCNLS